MPQLVVPAQAVGNQLIVAAPLNQPALVKDEDIAAKPAGGKAVGNVNGCFVPDNLIEMGIDLKLGKGVQGLSLIHILDLWNRACAGPAVRIQVSDVKTRRQLAALGIARAPAEPSVLLRAFSQDR